MKLLNEQKIGLSMAVFLAHDDYDYDPRPNGISATGMLKSPRQIILTKRVKDKQTSIDISTLAASTFGTAVHDGVEKAWANKNYVKAMMKLGIDQNVIDRVRVNPDPPILFDPNEDPDTRLIPIYMEKRSEKEVNGIIVTGKFDFVKDGELEDHKTTGVYTYIKKTNNEKFRLQGSIYRWLNPDIIRNDKMLINYVFTDWSALKAKIEKDRGYPPHRMMSVPITLMTLDETQTWIENKINEIKINVSRDEANLPPCTIEDLWQGATVYKYYKNPKSKVRSTKNFTTFAEAQTRLVKERNVGVIDIVPGMAKACNYCAGAAICSQAKQLVLDGLLDLEV